MRAPIALFTLLLTLPAVAATSAPTCTSFLVPTNGDTSATFASPPGFTVFHLDVEPRVGAAGRVAMSLRDGLGREVANHRTTALAGTDAVATQWTTGPGAPGTWSLATHGTGVGFLDVRVCFG